MSALSTQVFTTKVGAALGAVIGSVVAPTVVVSAWVVPVTARPEIATMVVLSLLVGFAALVVALPIDRLGEHLLTTLRPSLPTGRFHDAATDVTIGLDDPALLLVREETEVDVSGIPSPGRDVVVVTSAAFDVLTRREIVALAAARLAALRDPWCRLATNAALVWWSLRFVLPVAIAAALLSASRPATGAAAAVLALVVAAPRWPERARDRRADAVAIRAAQDPGGLAGAVRRLSGLGRRRDDLASADPAQSRRSMWTLPRLAGGDMTTDVGPSRRRRRYVLACAAALEAADQAVGMREPAGLRVVSGKDLRRRWAHLARPVDLD